MKIFEKLADVFAETAMRKQRAAQAHITGEKPNVESSYEVYLQACAQIASAFAEEGFNFAKSGPHFSKKAKPFTYRVAFQTSHNNIPGEHVALWMHANILSPTLKSWRQKQPTSYRETDWVAGGMVHLLQRNGPKFIEWDLADQLARDDTIDDAISYLRAVVMPYFKQFEHPSEIIKALKITPISAFEVASSVEFSLCFGSHEDAQQVLDAFVLSRPDLHEAIEKAGQKFKADGLPNSTVTAYADQVAWLRYAYTLH